MVSEVEAVETLVCGTSNYPVQASSDTLKEDAAEGTATGLENQDTGNCRGSSPPSSSIHTEAEKRGAVPITQK